MRLLQSGQYETVKMLKINTRLSHELETVMRNYLKYLLEREVKSITWLDNLREQIKQTAPEQEVALDAQDKPSQNEMALLQDDLY